MKKILGFMKFHDIEMIIEILKKNKTKQKQNKNEWSFSKSMHLAN